MVLKLNDDDNNALRPPPPDRAWMGARPAVDLRGRLRKPYRPGREPVLLLQAP